MRRGFIFPLAVLFISLWMGGTVAIYLSATSERRDAIRAIGLGLPLGVVYFAACFAVALIIVLPLKLFSMMTDG